MDFILVAIATFTNNLFPTVIDIESTIDTFKKISKSSNL